MSKPSSPRSVGQSDQSDQSTPASQSGPVRVPPSLIGGPRPDGRPNAAADRPLCADCRYPMTFPADIKQGQHLTCIPIAWPKGSRQRRQIERRFRFAREVKR